MARRKKKLGSLGAAKTCVVSAGNGVEFENDLDTDKMKLSKEQCDRFPVGSWLGRGSFASAYEHATDSDKVVKFTGDAREAAVASRFLGKRLKGSVTIFDIAKLKGKKAIAPVFNKGFSDTTYKPGQPVFALVTERVGKLSRVNAEAVADMNRRLRPHREDIAKVKPSQFRLADWVDAGDVAANCEFTTGNRKACDVAAQAVFDAVDEQAANGVIPLDLHSGNWGERADGSPVILDFGVSSAPGPGPKIALAKAPKTRRMARSRRVR